MRIEALFTLLATISVTYAHMALLYPVPRGGLGTPQYNAHIHTFIGYKDAKYTTTFPCGGYAPGPVTAMKAGDVIPVRFLSTSLSAAQIKTQPTKPSSPSQEISQARHGGGLCEFSLSYDGGKTYNKFASYTKSCPDAYFEWPVKIPANAPSCKTKGKCLFVWTWTANILDQFYQNCVDISLSGLDTAANDKLLASTTSGDLFGKGPVQIVDFAGQNMGVKAPGDGRAHNAGDGPSASEVAANTK